MLEEEGGTLVEDGGLVELEKLERCVDRYVDRLDLRLEKLLVLLYS